jgi:hypothetical protein
MLTVQRHDRGITHMMPSLIYDAYSLLRESSELGLRDAVIGLRRELLYLFSRPYHKSDWALFTADTNLDAWDKDILKVSRHVHGQERPAHTVQSAAGCRCSWSVTYL